MKNRDEIYVLYRFTGTQGDNHSQIESKYRLILVFNINGLISSSELKKANEDHHGQMLEFSTKEQMTQFLIRLIEENNYSRAYLLANNDFNIAIESAHNLLKLKELFYDYGFLIEADKSKNTKSFFGKIF